MWISAKSIKRKENKVCTDSQTDFDKNKKSQSIHLATLPSGLINNTIPDTNITINDTNKLMLIKTCQLNFFIVKVEI
jgi:hypothetical protein